MSRDKYVGANGATECLLHLLTGGPRDCREVRDAVRVHGYDRRALTEARRKLNVKTYNLGDGVFLWGLPWSAFPRKVYKGD